MISVSQAIVASATPDPVKTDIKSKPGNELKQQHLISLKCKTMAKVLLIRELSDEANAALERYKDKNGLRNNTDAAEGMIKNYFYLEDELALSRRMHQAADGQLIKIQSAYQRQLNAQDDFQRILMGQETREEEQKRMQRESLDKRHLQLITDRDRVLQNIRNRPPKEE